MSKSSDSWSNLTHSDETARKQEGPTAWDKVAASLAAAGTFAAGFAAEQVHAAGQDVVSRVLLGESYSPPETAKEPAREPEPEIEKDQGLDR